MTTSEVWQKSSFSGEGDGNACIEVASSARTIHLRESDEPAIELTATPAALTGLLHALKASEL
ncbi:DUF397 domain-containing protein [Streptomyces sp. NPDC059063]|uniref:DUF397 domain-containing protein n=1 Tax=unclassified Streptomyces TaxID=2593676 RepID=UPI0036ACBEF0